MPQSVRFSPLLSWCFLIILLFSESEVRAQQIDDSLELPLELLSIDDGLSQGMVNCTVQDKYGFLWFGTKDGLNRYDGLRFNVYRNSASDTNSLSDNYLQSIYEDSKGRLWIGTSREGLELFNRETETFYHIRLNARLNSLSNCVIKIQEDNDQNLWLGTSDGLFKISFNEQTVAGEKNDTKPQFSIKKYFQKSCNFQITKNGTLFGTSTGLFPFIIKPVKNGNDQIESLPADNYYWAPQGVDDRLKYTSVIVEDSIRKKVYFLYEYCFVEVDQRTRKAKVLFRRSPENATLPFNAIVDKTGLLWISTSGFLEQFNPLSGAIKNIVAKEYDNKNSASHVRSIYICKSGIFWIGTMGFGILKHNPEIQKFNSVPNYSTGWMSPAESGKIIVQHSGNSSLSLFDPQSGTFRNVMNDSVYCSKTGIPKARNTFSVVQDPDGIYWLNKGNLIRYNDETGELDFIIGEGLSGVPLYLSNSGDIWFSSQDAFSNYSPTSKKVMHWKYPFEISNDPYFFLQAIYRDPKGNFWLGTNNGLLFFNPVNSQWKNYSKEPGNSESLNNNVIFSVLPDPVEPGRFLWVGTNGGGLNRLEISTGKFDHFTENEGLPNNVVYGLLSDNSNNLWLSTNHGISRFNLKNKTFRNFDAQDGLQGNEFNRYSFCKDANGIMYFGGTNGLNYFHPDAIRDNPVKPNIVITSIKLKNKKIAFQDKNSPLTKPAYLEHKIEIPYSENMIAFEFAALEFSAPGKNLYKYRMNGFDKEWIQSVNTPNAIYTNLDPGDYTFIVKGSNNDGIWSDNEARLSVVILTPWYLSWWFRLSIILLVAAGIYKFYRYRLNQTIRLLTLRNTIASDLHDEIGSTLSSISLYGEVTKRLVSDNPEAVRMLTRINENTQQMMEAMSDIVWTINTRHDRLDGMISKMREFAIHAMEARNGEVHFNDTPDLSSISVDMNQRKNIYLIFKEAVNNAAKYSECKNLFVEFQIKRSGCLIKIRDDGKGFNPDMVKKGNGLYNMYKRIDVIKGDLSIHSKPGEGTEVVIKVLFG